MGPEADIDVQGRFKSNILTLPSGRHTVGLLVHT